jgi:2-methylfumaryl-CoA hydratase
VTPRQPKYGRLLSDFDVGRTYEHPWEVTVDAGMAALFAASFLDATPLYASRAYARTYLFEDRPLHPLLCLNLALSFSVHDVSEQAIAHLAYLDVRFPEAAYAGDTVTARSTVLGCKPASSGDKGVVHVRTVLEAAGDRDPAPQPPRIVCAFERKALVRAGRLDGRPDHPRSLSTREVPPLDGLQRLPRPLRQSHRPEVRAGFAGVFEDFAPGQVYLHDAGKTIGESEHMQLTALVRNSHPLHFDEVYCKDHSFQKTRVVYGGLVLSWVATLASRDVAGNALWDLGLDAGAHPNGVVGGDTLYAASKVLSTVDHGSGAGAVTFRLVGVKNRTAASAYAEHGDALFEEELPKKAEKIKEKVVEITRTLYIRSTR